MRVQGANPLSFLDDSLENSLFLSSFMSLRNQSKKKKKAAELFKIQHFKASFITKLKTFKTNLGINLISASPYFLKMCFLHQK